MKTLLAILFIFLTSFCFAQTHKSTSAVYDLKIPYRPATIKILTDSNSFPSTVVNNSQTIIYTDVKPGYYKVQISGEGQETVVLEEVIVKEGQKLVLNFKILGPCLFDHPTGYIPTCPKNHKDSIVPIIYGLIVSNGNAFIKNQKDLKVKYAGCVTTDCDPKLYCKQHDIVF